MRFATFAVALALAVSSARPSYAQRPPAPPDSVPRDSVARDSVTSDSLPADSIRRGPIHPWWGPLVLPIAVVGALVLLYAPAPLASWAGTEGPSEMSFVNDHVAFQASLGGRFSEGETWVNTVSLEVVRRRVHVEVRAEDFWRPRHMRYVTARAGYLWHPRARGAATVTVGYVHSANDASHSGIELGLPLYYGTRKLLARLEPGYVFSKRGLLWNYRAQFEVYLARERYVVGMNVMRKSLSFEASESDELSPQGVTALVGVRF